MMIPKGKVYDKYKKIYKNQHSGMIMSRNYMLLRSKMSLRFISQPMSAREVSIAGVFIRRCETTK